MRSLFFQVVAALTLTIWLSLCFFIIFNSQPIIDNIVSLAQIIFYAATFLMMRKVYQECRIETRQALFLFLVAILIALITDSINYCVLFILNHVNFFVYGLTKTSISQVDKFLYVSDYIEIFFWYIIVFIFLINLLRKFFVKKQRYQIQFSIFAACLALSLIVLLYLSQPDKLQHANFFTYISFASSVIEIATFIVVIYGLIHSKSWSLYLLLSSMILMIITQISALFYYSYHIQEFQKLSYFSGTLWVMMTFLTFNYMHEKKEYDLQKWFVTPDSLEARLAFSTLVISCLSFIVFFILAYILNLLNEQKLLSFFLFLMIYSLFAALAAKRVALSFARPFKQLQINMGELMTTPNESIKLVPFEVAEFDFLQNFIVKRFMEHESQIEKIKTMGKMVLQVAHDIRSPVAAIMMFAKTNENLPEEQRILLRSAATRAQDIANNILTEYQQKSSSLKKTPMMLVPAILSVISEKRSQYYERQLKISINIAQTAYFSHIKINPIEFKRALSNIINNAVDAFGADITGKVEISIDLHKENVIIKIQDNGCSIKPELLLQLNNNSPIQSSKKEGLGLGLQHARKLMQDSNGTLHFESNINSGTIVILSFKLAATPCWLIEKIRFSNSEQIIILDDDEAIHAAWDQRFKIWKEKNSSLNLKHFYSAIDCLAYIRSLTSYQLARNLLLSDYELINQNMTGLDVIENCGIANAILVTSYYENEDIIKRAILANAKILPKMLASEVELEPGAKIEKKRLKKVDAILLDNQVELSNIMQFLAENRNIILDTYSNPYQLWENLDSYSKETVFYLDYDLELSVDGVSIAKRLYSMGYKALYLATGFHLNETDLPEYLKILPNKIAFFAHN